MWVGEIAEWYFYFEKKNRCMVEVQSLWFPFFILFQRKSIADDWSKRIRNKVWHRASLVLFPCTSHGLKLHTWGKFFRSATHRHTHIHNTSGGGSSVGGAKWAESAFAIPTRSCIHMQKRPLIGKLFSSRTKVALHWLHRGPQKRQTPLASSAVLHT